PAHLCGVQPGMLNYNLEGRLDHRTRRIKQNSKLSGYPWLEARNQCRNSLGINVDSLDGEHVVAAAQYFEQNPRFSTHTGFRPDLNQVAKGVANKGRTTPIKKRETHFTDDSVRYFKRATRFRINQLEKAMIA